nr:hypothetical protein Iba_chr04cCG16870 [Ipomoea batatas]
MGLQFTSGVKSNLYLVFNSRIRLRCVRTTNAWGTKLFLKTYCSSLIGFTSGDTVSGDSEADSGAEDHSQGSDFEKVTGLDDFDEDLGDGSAVLPL